MNRFNPVHILHGNGGTAYFSGKRLVTLQKCELKVTGDFEEVNVCDDPATYSIYNGYSGEGSLTYFKVDSEILKMMAKAFKSGIMPELSLVTRLHQPSTGQSERISVSGITVTEFMLANFEKKSKIEEEMPFKFSNFEVLEAIL